MYPNSIEHGYIGVTHRTAYKRFLEHKNDKNFMRSIIKKHKINFDQHVKILYDGSILECYNEEKRLRPQQRMGWNVATGGAGYNYKSDIDDLSKFRSELQKERMSDDALRKQQGICFKENYYNDENKIKLRKQRAKEHMADPIKKEKCLGAIHKKIKCDYCNFISNVGNVKQHIRKCHNVN